MSQSAAGTAPKPPTPHTENERLYALDRSNLLDTPAEEIFNRITRIAQAHFNVPIALISLVDKDRQWFKARCGIDASGTSRDDAFCAYTILDHKVMVIPDATKNVLFMHNPLVTGEPNIRFYAGAPLIVPDGLALGTLCVIDTKPHHDFSKEDEQILTDLAGIVAHLIELRVYKHLSLV